MKFFKGLRKIHNPFAVPKGRLCVSNELSFRSVARQVFSPLQSLTSVFGMGTGGPSALKSLTASHPKMRRFCVGIELSFRSVARQVFSPLQSLTSVFGMGTGGPSALKTPTFMNTLCPLKTEQSCLESRAKLKKLVGLNRNIFVEMFKKFKPSVY